jgi:hypothetical protein
MDTFKVVLSPHLPLKMVAITKNMRHDGCQDMAKAHIAFGKVT